jgi:DNA modification methylase
LRVVPNWAGRNSSSVLSFNASHYGGPHPATMPEDMAQWLLSAACDDNAHVVDPFGGVGTFALAALRLGHRATSIDIFDQYTEEGIERLKHAPVELPVKDQENESRADSTEGLPPGTHKGLAIKPCAEKRLRS